MTLRGADVRNLFPTGAESDSIDREAWKIFQMMAEFVSGFDKMSDIHPAVSVFGSARTRRSHSDYKLARKVARALSDSGFSVISGGGPGIMEAVNRGAQSGKSPSIGLNIILPGRQETPNPYQDISIDFHHFFARKLMFVRYASAYVVMPGGFGTLDEVVECLTLIQTEKTPRIPVVFVNSQFWGGLLSWFEHTLLSSGTISESDLELFSVADEPSQVCDTILGFYEKNGFDSMDDHARIKL
ncbi:MAG: TIGR00730 family Rossman fold protein [Pseudomonadota bacterium]